MATWDQEQDIITEAIEKAVKLGYLTMNPIVTISAVSSLIQGKLGDLRANERKQQELNTMFDLMRKHFPQEFSELLEKMKGKNL